MTIILGGGMTGLAAGMTSGGPVYEASNAPGGICSSYYVRPGFTWSREHLRLLFRLAKGRLKRTLTGGTG